jgi:hypothetical protein
MPMRLRRTLKRALSVVLLIVVLRLVWFLLVMTGVPWIPAREDQSGRAAVVEQIMAGRLAIATGSDDVIHLPIQYADLSMRGVVHVYRNDAGGVGVLFITRNGVIDHYEGYVYQASGAVEDDPLGGGAISVRSLGGGWYSVFTY